MVKMIVVMMGGSWCIGVTVLGVHGVGIGIGVAALETV